MNHERTDSILNSLDKLGFATRYQIQTIHQLGSNRNACRVLKNMSPFLNHFRDGQNIYYLNKAGRERVGSQKVRTRALNVKHTIMRNDLYIYFNQPEKWFVEQPIARTITPDVLFIDSMGRYVVAEIDNTQKMKNNLMKIQRYKELKDSGVFQQRYKHFPMLVFYTASDVRKEKLAEECGELNHMILTEKDLL